MIYSSLIELVSVHAKKTAFAFIFALFGVALVSDPLLAASGNSFPGAPPCCDLGVFQPTGKPCAGLVGGHDHRDRLAHFLVAFWSGKSSISSSPWARKAGASLPSGPPVLPPAAIISSQRPRINGDRGQEHSASPWPRPPSTAPAARPTAKACPPRRRQGFVARARRRASPALALGHGPALDPAAARRRAARLPSSRALVPRVPTLRPPGRIIRRTPIISRLFCGCRTCARRSPATLHSWRP